MSDNSVLAAGLLNSMPVSIRNSLLSDSDFCSKYGISQKVQITINSLGLTIDRSIFYDSIRQLYSTQVKSLALKDISGTEWELKFTIKDDTRNVVISQGDKEFILPDYSALSIDPVERSMGIQRIINDYNFSKQFQVKWLGIVAKGPVTNEELDVLHKDIQESPVWFSERLKSDMVSGITYLSELFPNSDHYYKQLVGEYSNNDNIIDFAQNVAFEQIKHLISWNSYEGLLLALVMSSYSWNLPKKIIEIINEEELIRVFQWLQLDGDLISKVGAIEIGLSIFDKYPKIEPLIKSLIEQLRDDDPNNPDSRFRLLSALIVLAEGEVCRTMVLRGSPPFWRRLATIAHASLIERAVIKSYQNTAQFSSWAMDNRSELFYLQNMCDLRIEPRWYPDFVLPQQLKNELISRILITANKYLEKIGNSSLNKLILGREPDSLFSNVELPYVWLCGPLEGSLDPQLEVPLEIKNIIENELSENDPDLKSFVLLTNTSLIFRLGLTHAQLAVKALRSAKYHLKHINSKDLLVSVLRGLSTVAAATRSTELANEIMVITRHYRHKTAEYRLAAQDALWIGLVAAAAFENQNDWCNYVGEWMTELTFQTLEKDEVFQLHLQLKHLCHIVPELWRTCGRAEAALSSCKN